MRWKHLRTIGLVAARNNWTSLLVDLVDSVGIVPSGVQSDLYFCRHDGWQIDGYEL